MRRSVVKKCLKCLMNMFLVSDSLFLQHFWDFLMIYALLSRDFDVEIYALFPQFFFGQNSLPRNITRFLHVWQQTNQMPRKQTRRVATWTTILLAARHPPLGFLLVEPAWLWYFPEVQIRKDTEIGLFPSSKKLLNFIRLNSDLPPFTEN